MSEREKALIEHPLELRGGLPIPPFLSRSTPPKPSHGGPFGLDRMPRILVVDDQSWTFDLIADIFNDECEVLFAADGSTALRIASLEKPAVILLDIMMPGLDGYEVCRLLAKDTETKDIPIFFLTGLDDARQREKGLALGVVDYITKPIDPADVRRRVNRQLARQG